ncbi:MAG: rhomboid family intramembrane serine protease [Gammaproteobacteria bacterium]|nr:rhomboid family intramembrane serine protease [Gammaproteobacteria bacterium]
MLLIFPTEVPLSKRHLPWLTLTLILLTTISFLLFQLDDNAEESAAINYYLEQGQFENERELFAQYLNSPFGQRDYQSLSVVATEGPERVYYMIFDQQFRHFVREMIQFDDPADAAQWRLFDAELQQRISAVTYFEYGLRSDHAPAQNYLTHMFLHGDIFHLIGNLVFLFLFGFGVERLLGGFKMALVYLIAGAIGGWIFTMLSGKPYLSLVGASGAISGLMGAYTGYFGTQRIRFFAWFGIYFNHFQWPAVLVLLFWLVKEAFYHLFDAQSNIAYLAHFGGLMAGVLLGWLFRATQRSAPPAQQEAQINHYANALEHIRLLDFDRARQALKQALKQSPNHLEAMKSLYNLEKTNLGSPNFKHAINLILATPPHQTAIDPFILQINANHVGKHFSVAELEIEALFNLLIRLLRNDQVQSSTPHIAMAKKRFAEHQRLPQLLYQWGLALAKRGKYRSAATEMNYLANYYGESHYGKLALDTLQSWREQVKSQK